MVKMYQKQTNTIHVIVNAKSACRKTLYRYDCGICY